MIKQKYCLSIVIIQTLLFYLKKSMIPLRIIFTWELADESNPTL